MRRRGLSLIPAALLFIVGHAWGMQPLYWERPYQEVISKPGQADTTLRAPKATSAPIRAMRAVPAALPAVRQERAKPVQVLPPTPKVETHISAFTASPRDRSRTTEQKPAARPQFLPEITGEKAGFTKAAAAAPSPVAQKAFRFPVRAKALYCLDCSSNKVMLAHNVSEPMPIASITKLLTAMVAIDEMNLDSLVQTPKDIREVPKQRVGIRPGDLFTVRDLLHGMLIESGNDCAEALARSYPKGGRSAFIAAMNRKARKLGATRLKVYTPSGLDAQVCLGRKLGRDFEVRRANVASAEDVALLARHAFQYPLIRQISSMKTYTMRAANTVPRDYPLVSNDKLLDRSLPVAGAKTGFTNMAGKCIVALFKNQGKEHMVVVLNTPKHFKAAEKIYRWASQTL